MDTLATRYFGKTTFMMSFVRGMAISAPTATTKKFPSRYIFFTSFGRKPKIRTMEMWKADRSSIIFIIRYITTRKISAEAADMTMTMGRIRSEKTPAERWMSARLVML